MGTTRPFWLPTFALALALVLVLSDSAAARKFTSNDGKTIEAEFVSATKKNVTLRLVGGKNHTFPLTRLSEKDQEYVANMVALLKEKNASKEEARRKAEATALAAKTITAFAMNSLGKQIGNGECWTLADEAFKAAGVKRPGDDVYVWGRIIDWKKEDCRPGDIVQFKDATFKNGTKIAHHTAVIVNGGKGVVTIHHQNWAGSRKVRQDKLALKSLVSGAATVYRAQPGEGPAR